MEGTKAIHQNSLTQKPSSQQTNLRISPRKETPLEEKDPSYDSYNHETLKNTTECGETLLVRGLNKLILRKYLHEESNYKLW